MSRLLYAWEGSRLVGVFEASGADGGVSFSYASGTALPISLSLPLSGEWADQAPLLFLDGLLPDDNNERWRMKDSLGSDSIHPFDLLDSVDAAGGLCFTKDDVPPAPLSPLLAPMTTEDIEAAIRRIAIEPRSDFELDKGSKFSLAGTQGKFTMVRYGNGWYRPNVGLASTHIVKPGSRRFPDSSYIECATMTLASLCGLPTPNHGLIEAGDLDAYIVERFDRRLRGDGLADRLRVEDMTQALAVSRTDKYDVGSQDVCAALLSADPTGELAYQWFDQFIFNALSGNCDAHGKNYSIVFNESGVALSPVYDCVCTLVWESLDPYLAMSVDGKWLARELSPDDWGREAELCGLDGGRIADRSIELSQRIVGFAEEACRGLGDDVRSKIASAIAQANERMGLSRGHVPLVSDASDVARRASAREPGTNGASERDNALRHSDSPSL